MKILVVGLSAEMGGTENYIYNLVQRLDPRKYNMDFLAIDEGKTTPYHDELNKYYDDGNEHCFYCPNLKKHWVTGNNWLKNFYDDHHYDLIYMNATTSARVIYCQYAINKYRIPLITHSHRSDGKKINHYLYRRYTRKNSIFKLACSQNAAEWMFGKNEKDYKIISNGILTEKFAFDDLYRKKIRNELNISEEEFVIGHVGRFSEEKNHKFFIELAHLLDKKYIFMLIGEGPLKDQFKELVNSEKLEDRFFVLNGTKEVNTYYSAMDVFMMPSFNEGLPIVSVEAQCNGLNCIFSDTVSRETNLLGSCIYLPLDNPNQWKKVLESNDFNRVNGKEKIRDAGFDMEYSATIVSNLFNRAIKTVKEI